MTNKLKCILFEEMIASEVIFCEGGIHTELVMGAGRPTNVRNITNIEHEKNPPFPFFTGLNNNPNVLGDLKDALQQSKPLMVK